MTETPQTSSARFRLLASASAVAGLFAYALTVSVIPASLNQISPIAHNSDALIGWLFRVWMVGFFVFVLVGGHYSDRRGKLPVMLAGCLLMAVGSLGFARAQTYSMIALMVLVLGAGGGFVEAIAMGVIADVTSSDRRTSVMNLAQVFFAIGAVVGPLAVTWLLAISTGYWRWAYVMTGVFCILAALTAASAVARREERPAGAAHSGEWKSLIKDRYVLALSAGILIYVGAETGQASWLARYFKEDLVTSAPLAAATVAIFWAGIGAGRSFAIWTSRHLSDYAIICIAHAAALVCQVALLVTDSTVVALASVAMLGFGLAPGWPTIVSIASALHPNQTGTVLGIVVSAGALGAAVFPPAIGQLADHIGLRHSLWLCVLLLVVNLCLFIRLWLRNRAVSEAP